jgi:hypothetical protein
MAATSHPTSRSSGEPVGSVGRFPRWKSPVGRRILSVIRRPKNAAEKLSVRRQLGLRIAEGRLDLRLRGTAWWLGWMQAAQPLEHTAKIATGTCGVFRRSLSF